MRRHATTTFALAGRFYRLAWTGWGDPGAPVVVCVHGLTRQGRDFDALAAALSDQFHVVCPDLPGRGGSDWLADAALYAPASYVVALTHLLAALGGGPVDWVGTSLGGICGMAVAAMPGNPIRRLVLNDIGPRIPRAALARIAAYMGSVPERFADIVALEAYLRQVHAPFGPLTDAQWAAMARHSARPLPGGGLALHYDPAVAVPMLASEPADVDLSSWWRAITVPRLVIRGASSDLLLPDTFAAMQADGAEALEVADAGHAPALMDAAQVAAVRGFLLG